MLFVNCSLYEHDFFFLEVLNMVVKPTTEQILNCTQGNNLLQYRRGKVYDKMYILIFGKVIGK